MKKYFFLIFVVSLSGLSAASAQNSNAKWLCNADVTKGTKLKIYASVNVGDLTKINIYSKNDAAGRIDNREILLPYVSDSLYQNLYGDSCTNQFTGIEEHSFSLSVETKKASYVYSWCDDDGGSGFESYDLTCTEL